jgi:hypothetical protein
LETEDRSEQDWAATGKHVLSVALTGFGSIGARLVDFVVADMQRALAPMRVLPSADVPSTGVSQWLRGREFSVFDHYDQADAAQVARLSAGSMSASLWRPGIGPYCCGDLRDALMHGQAAVGGASLFLRSARETDVDRLAAIMHRLGHQCGWMIGVLGWADLTMEELADWLELWPGMLPDDILPSTAFALVPEAHLHLPDRESSALVLSWETVGESPVLTTMSDLHRMGSVSCLVESEIFR